MKVYLYLLIILIAFKTKSERNAISQASRKGGKALKKKKNMGNMKRAMVEMIDMGLKPTNENLSKYIEIKRKKAIKNGTTIREEIRKGLDSKMGT